MKRALMIAVLMLFTTSVSLAQDTPAGGPPPGAMPPGMTPEIMKMMMTPGEAHPKGLPDNMVPVMGCIPSMGYHYEDAKSGPYGPFYGYYNGKAIFTEVMVSKPDFDKGSNWDDQLKPLPGYKIDHVDIWWEPHGHPGYLVPHYDIHAWYVPHAEHMKYCGNTSGTKPAFL